MDFHHEARRITYRWLGEDAPRIEYLSFKHPGPVLTIVKWARQDMRRLVELIQSQGRTVSGLRGVITRLRRRIEQLERDNDRLKDSVSDLRCKLRSGYRPLRRPHKGYRRRNRWADPAPRKKRRKRRW